MPKSERTQKSREFINAYRNNEADVEVIPSNTDLFGEEPSKKELVGAYCRVSTMSDMQVESYELQKAYYEEMVTRQPTWTLVGIYPDEGISGTSMRNRRNFLRMIEDCKQGKLTLIVTKSISRFARNVVDAISTVRMLRNLPQPVAVLFETEQINTMRPGADSMLSLLASFAESESLIKSTSMKWAIRNRFKHGIPRIVDTYGFERERNKLTPHEGSAYSKADVVREIYREFIETGNLSHVRRVLHKKGIPSPMGREWWSITTLAYVLANEKYVGDVLMQKTVRIDMFSHKSVKNKGLERQYRIQDHHEAIVSRDEWVQAQRLLGTSDMSYFLVGEAETLDGIDGSIKFMMLQPNLQVRPASEHNLSAERNKRKGEDETHE